MLKDITKILVGVFLCDMLVGIWLISENMLPISFLGLDWSFSSIIIAVLAEFVILILLVYYSWFWKKTIKQENKETINQN